MVWMIRYEMQDRSVPYFELDPIEDQLESSRSFGFSQGYWVDPDSQPKSAYQTTKKLVHDVFPLPGINAVRQCFKDLVEEFEPGLHQFMPIALRDKQGEPIPDNFYIFNCAVAFDCVLVSETGVEVQQPVGEPPEYRLGSEIKYGGKIVVSKPATEGHHLWMGHHLRPSGSWVFVSDEFYKELKKRKIKYVEALQLKEADIPWRAEEQIKPIVEWEATQPFEKWSGWSRLRKRILDERGRLEP